MGPLLAGGMLAIAVVLAGATAATATRPSAPLPDHGAFLERWAQLHGGYDPLGNRWVRGWLGLTYRLARPLARRGVHPHMLTLWNGWLALAVPVLALSGGAWPLVAALVLVLSSVADALDGSVAALTDRASRAGAVLDRGVDRVAEVCFLAALWAVGAPVWLAVAVGVGIALFELGRARAAAGGGPLESVTVAERPTRVICCAGGLASAGLLPAHAGLVASGWLGALGVLTLVGLAQLLVTGRRRR